MSVLIIEKWNIIITSYYVFPHFCILHSRHRIHYIFIKMPHNVCSNLIGKTQEIIKLMIWDIGKYCWMPGIGKCCDLPIYRYSVNRLCCVLCLISQWKQSLKKDTSHYKHQWIYDVPTQVQFIFIEVRQTWFTLSYNHNTTMIFIMIYNHNITMLLTTIKGPFNFIPHF